VVALYEDRAVLASPPGQQTVGIDAIRVFYERLLAITVRAATAEIARRQPDDTWLWIIDQPNIVPGDR
jgi:ketosteroid isomerase-like protein